MKDGRNNGGRVSALLARTCEPLDPELLPYVRRWEAPFDWAVLKHPLVFMVPYVPELAAWANESLAAKKAAVAEADAERDFGRAVFLHERPFRLEAFLHRQGRGMRNREYWRLLAAVWRDCKSPHVNIGMWHRLWFDLPRGGRKCWAMEPAEEERFATVTSASEATLWRGAAHAKAMRGLSWTTDPEVARWFATRFADSSGLPGTVWRATVPSARVAAVLDGRGESEVVADMRDLPARMFAREEGLP